jgi:cytidylate kinase
MSEIITIDGPTSSGKSSVGLLFSQKVGYQFIDTGRIYRAGALYILKNGIPVEDEGRVAEVFKNLRVEFKEIEGKVRIFLDDEDITAVIHTPHVTALVPKIAAFPKAREYAKQLQKSIGGLRDTVMAGRDIGSEIFPDAKLKFFITADINVRAQRRLVQIKKTNPNVKFEEILSGMKNRDNDDSTRKASPMRVQNDAIIIDTTDMTTEETVEKMRGYFYQSELKS